MLKLSKFGTKFTQPSGIHQLMLDLGDAQASNHPDLCMLGGGNPAPIPAAQALFNAEMTALMDSGQFQDMLGLYDGPQGEASFRQSLCGYLNRQFDWDITPENISLTNGSQNSFFYLFNALAGEMEDGGFKRILFPIAPEYVGYADAGLTEDMFESRRPIIERLENKQFKYHIDFDNLNVNSNIGAICLSRPTNPTGNVVTDEELAKLSEIAATHGIPLIIDNAYGQPFPNVIHQPANTPWNEDIVLCMSLSKLGLPGARTGIVIANKAITDVVSSLSGIITLAPNSVGAALMTRMIEDNDIEHLTQNIIRPFYKERLEVAQRLFYEIFADLPVLMHKPEGAFFIWLWLEDLPITTRELYQRLKKKHLYVIPGEEFFIGIDKSWPHTQQCLRLNYAKDDAQLKRGLELIAQELRSLIDR